MEKIEKISYQDISCLRLYKDIPELFNWVAKRVGYCESLLDYGCGRGHLYGVLNSNHILPENYVGVDIKKEHVQFCQGLYPDASWVLSEDLLPDTSECVVSIGTLCFSYDFLATLSDLRSRANERLIFDYVRDDLLPCGVKFISCNRSEIYLIFQNVRHIEFEHIPGSLCDVVYIEF